MIKQQRRVFLKVIAVGPLVGCAGADAQGSLSGGMGGGEGNVAGGAVAAGGTASAGGTAGKPSGAGGSSSSTGGNPFFGGGSSAGGNPFANSGGSGSVAVGGTSAVGTGGVSSGTAGSASVDPNLTPVGNVSSVPLGAFQIAGGIFFLGRDAGGLYAMSMQCTHKFCAVVISGNELDCPCHHSRFDRAGNVLQGPATTPLPYYAVFVDAAGNISVNKYKVVSSSTRTPI